MQLLFRAIREDKPGEKWAAHFERVWPSYESWFLREGDGRRPGYLSCRRALGEHMPELVPLWQELCELAGGSDRVARMLSLYRPTPYMSGCSQLQWRRDEPMLIRNYDYHPELCEGLLLASAWSGTRVIASVDSLWGVLDGINEHGLAVSLAFGGREVVGDGFGMPLVLRYVLETCSSVAGGVEVLRRVPTHMAYTIALVDKSGASATVFTAPDRPAVLDDAPFSTNHQRDGDWPAYAVRSNSVGRREVLERLAAAADQLEPPVEPFLDPPLYMSNYSESVGTLYTAVYRTRSGSVDLRWPTRSWTHSFSRFTEGEALIRYPVPS